MTHGFVINEDNSHYFGTRGIDGANETAMRALARNYCRGQAVEVVYNLNAQRSSVAGLPFEPIWDEVEDRGGESLFYRGKPVPAHFANWLRCAKKAHDLGLNPYEIWLDETRELGRRACISIRMNDIHCVDDEESFFHSRFWRQHPEFHREQGGLFHGWDSAALDYSHQEVRDYAFRMVKAVLERYDMDGLELDWMRFGHSVRPGQEDESRALLTEFHAAVREAARSREKELGHPVTLSVRCPALPREAFDMGYDVVGWAREGLIDRVVPTPFFSTTDSDIPIAFWRSILPAGFPIDAGIEIRIQPYPWSDHIMESPSALCAQAANYFRQGADRIYLFNHMDSETTMPQGYQEIFELVGDPAAAARHERRHIVTFHDRRSCGSPVRFCLPMECGAGRASDYLRIEVGPAPEPGRRTELIVGVDGTRADLAPVLNGIELKPLRTQANEKCKTEGAANTLDVFSSLQEIPLSSRTLCFYDASEAVKAGRNVFWFRNRSADSCKVTWAEIRIEAAKA